MLVWLAGFFGAYLYVSHLVWSGVGASCGYYRVVVSGCVQSSVLYISMYKVAKSRHYTYSVSVSVHVHVEVCSGISSNAALCIR